MIEYYRDEGLLLQKKGLFKEAIICFQKALKVGPPDDELYLFLSQTYLDMGQSQPAIQVLKRALIYFPAHVLILNQLASIYQKAQQYTQALNYFKQAIESHPEEAITYNNLGVLLSKWHYYDEAEQAFSEALFYHSEYLQAWHNLGNLYSQTQQYERSQACYERALDVDSEAIPVYVSLAENLIRMGDVEEARRCYADAIKMNPLDSLKLQKILLLPPIYQSQKELDECRKTLFQNLKELESHSLSIKFPLDEINKTLFYLAYQGYDDRELMELFARILRPLLPETCPVDTAEQNPSIPQQIRIGFISRYFHKSSVMDCFANHILGLSRESFHIQLFAIPDGREDQLTKLLKQNVDGWIDLPDSLEQARERIAQQELDILVYTDLGVEPYSYYLAFTRLATHQYVLSGFLTTTGIPTVDYFVSSQLAELPEAQDFYSEKLILLSGNDMNYSPPSIPEKIKGRAVLNLPENKNLYICPMTLFKVHPSFDEILLKILQQDPDGVVVFFEYKQTKLHELLQKRFQESLKPVLSQILFQPWVSFQELVHILCQADVVLDTICFGGGTTAYLTLALGVPMVTWPSPYFKGRSCFALYQRMNYMDCVASSFDEYVVLANTIAMNPELRANVSTEILSRHSVLLDNPEGVEELSHIFKENLSGVDYNKHNG